MLAGTPQLARERTKPGFLPKEFSKSDRVTRETRNGSRVLYRIPIADSKVVERSTKLGVVVAQDATSIIVAAVADAKFPLNAQKFNTEISLPGKVFDPIIRPPAGTVPFGLERAPQGDGYYIVQFGITATDELLDSLRSTGVEILQYVPHQAFFVFGSGEAIAKAATHSRVRWVGDLRPEYKISQELTKQLEAVRRDSKPADGIASIQRTGKSSAIFDVAAFKRADLDAVGQAIGNMGGRVLNKIVLPENFFDVIRVEMPLTTVEFVGNIPDVIRIDAWSQPTKEDERAAQIVAGNFSSATTISPPGYDPLTQFGVNGQNVTVAVVDDGVGIPGDGGFYVTASNAIDGPLRGASAGAQGHGHLQASIIAGDTPFSVLDPTGYNYGLGIAPKSNIVNIPLLRAGYTGTEADSANDAVTWAGPNGVLTFISNNSWGNGTNGNAYDSYAAQFDGFVRDSSSAPSIDPMLFVFSAGNDGSNGLTRPKVAKNLIATANLENLRTELDSGANNIDDLSGSSAIGPASDGRVKPDIAAPGTAITGGRSGSSTLFGNIDAAHRWSTGTSHAAPQVAGAAALFTQFWKNGHSGANPSPALVKAALINGAQDANGNGTSAAIPNSGEGWGRVYLKGVLNTGVATTYVNEDDPVFGTGAVRTYNGSVADITKPVRVTLVWTDPPAVGNPALVNDLDLEVTVGGNTYKGNVLSGGVSTTSGSADALNNVENVFLPAGVSGPITIRVNATAINGNGVLGNGDATDQHFALVVYNSAVTADASVNLSMETPFLISGNALIEPSECNQLQIPLVNSGDVTATTVSAALSTTTPGVSIQPITNAYPDITANGGIQNSITPFQISTDNSLACFTNIDLTLTVQYSGGGSPQVFTFSLPVGQAADPNYTFSNGSGTISATGSLVTGSRDDDVVVDVTAPFSFSIYSANISSGSTIRLGSNGFIIAGTGGTGNGVNNAALPSSAIAAFPASVPILMPYWDDLDMRPSITSSGGIFTEVTGSPGSQTFKVEWRARHFVAGQSIGPVDTNFAVYFHENSNQFEFVYDEAGEGINANGVSATVGVQAATTGSLFTQYSFNGPALTSGLKLSAAQTIAICSAGTGACDATAADATASGRVLGPNGRGVANATVSITSVSGETRTTLTNSFGYFRFMEIEAGETYVVSVVSRRFTFSSRIIQVSDNVEGLDFVAEN